MFFQPPLALFITPVNLTYPKPDPSGVLVAWPLAIYLHWKRLPLTTLYSPRYLKRYDFVLKDFVPKA